MLFADEAIHIPMVRLHISGGICHKLSGSRFMYFEMPSFMMRSKLRWHLIAPVAILIISVILEVYIRTVPHVDERRMAMERLHHIPVAYCRTLSCLQSVDCGEGRHLRPPKVDHLANLGAYDVVIDFTAIDTIAIRRFHRQMKRITSDDLYRQHDNKTRRTMHRVNIALAMSQDFLLQNSTDDLIKSTPRPEGMLHTWLSQNSDWISWTQCIAANEERVKRQAYVEAEQRSAWSCAQNHVQSWRIFEYLRSQLEHTFTHNHCVPLDALTDHKDNQQLVDIYDQNNNDEYKHNNDDAEIDDEAKDENSSNMYDEPDAWFYSRTAGKEESLDQGRIRSFVRPRNTTTIDRESNFVAKRPSKTHTAMPMRFTETSGNVISCTPNVPVPLYPDLDHLKCQSAITSTITILDPFMSFLEDLGVVLIYLVLIDILMLPFTLNPRLLLPTTTIFILRLDRVCQWLEAGSIARRPIQLRYLPPDLDIAYIDSPASDVATFLRFFFLEPGIWFLSKLRRDTTSAQTANLVH